MANDKTPEAKASEDERVLEKTQNDDAEDENEESEGEEAEEESGAEATDDDAAGEVEADADAGEEAEAASDDEKPTKSKLKRERQKERMRELERITQEATARAEAAERALKEFKDDLGDEPKSDDYEDPNDYTAAKAAYEADKRAIARQRKAHETSADATKAEAAKTQRDLFRERAIALTDRYPDIEAKVFGDNSLPINPAMAEVVMASERGPEVAYYLAGHREEAQRIASMPPLSAARELGRIEARLSAPQPRTETKAPPPTKILKGKSGQVTKDPAKMTHEEYRQWRASMEG